MIDALAGKPVFELSILGCLAVSIFGVISQLRSQRLMAAPITCCVIGLLAAIGLSHLAHLKVTEAVSTTLEFCKVVVYYLLLVAVVNTPRRLHWFVIFVLGCLTLVTALALLNYFGVIENPALDAVYDWVHDDVTGEAVQVKRLSAAGIFANPNDVARIQVIGIALSLYLLANRKQLILAPVWLSLAGLFAYAFSLTYSRGAFIGLVVTFLVLLLSLIPGRKALLLAVVALPVLFVLFGGRQTSLTLEDGTGQQRIQLWSEGMTAWRQAPAFGIGMGMYPELTNKMGAHNSFLHAYVELGLVGGTFFLAAFGLALRDSYRLGRLPSQHPQLGRLHPFLIAITAGYAVSLLSSSRTYVMPTYMILGLSCVYQRLASVHAPNLAPRLSVPLALRLGVVSVLVVSAFYVFIRLTIR